MEKHYRFEELSPCVREAGLQGADSWRLRPRRIYDHQLMYCFGHPARLSIEGRAYRLTRGDLALICPNTPHTFFVDDNKPGDILWVHFDFEAFEEPDWVFDCYNSLESYAQLFSSALRYPEHIRPRAVLGEGLRLPEMLHLSRADEAERLLRQILKLYGRGDPLFPILSKALMLELFALVLSENEGAWNTRRNSVSELSETLRHYMNNNYFKPLSLETIAATVHLSPDYCSRIFRRETGKTVVEYLSSVRVNVAKQLLLDGDLSIADIAEMVGFKRAGYFARVSQRLTGMTPSELRRYMLSMVDDKTAEGGETHV